MPFPLIPTALGLCFLLMWAFIAGMIIRDGQLAARRDQEMDADILPLNLARPAPSAANMAQGSNRMPRTGSARAAS